MNEQLDCELSPEVVSVITKPLEINVLAQGNLLRSHNKRFENLPEDIKVSDSKWRNSWLYEEDFSWTMFRDNP